MRVSSGLFRRSQFRLRRKEMTMFSRIALAFAFATVVIVALPAFVATSHAQATVPWGECTTNYYGTGPC
jgi:hypothetical protein